MEILNGVETVSAQDIVNPDIDGGTIDGTIIGGTTPAAGTFTIVTGTTANANALILGGAAAEGGDIAIYRDASGNTQLTLDADAASNAKALDVYGGVLFQNNLVVGTTSFSTTYEFYVAGTSYHTSHITINGNHIINPTTGYGIAGVANATDNVWNIPVTGTDATNHEIKLQIDSNTIIGVKGTGDGAGGVQNLFAQIYKPLCFTGTPEVVTDGGAISVTCSTTHVVTTDGAYEFTLADGVEGQTKFIVFKTDNGDATITPANYATGTSILFNVAGECAQLLFTNSEWHWMGGRGDDV